MKVINEDIKTNSFKPIYFLYGEEDYLKKQMKDRLSKAISGDDTMNLTIINEKLKTFDELISIGQTLPFFSEKRLIVLNDADIFSLSSSETFENFLQNQPEYLHIIIVEKTADKRKKLFKTINEKGYVTELNAQSTENLGRFIATKCKEAGKNISNEVILKILKRTGSNLGIISNELEKLFSYTYDSPSISLNDVAAICNVQLEDRVFDMISAIAGKKQELAFRLYYDLLALKEPPVKILILMERHFFGMLQVKTADPSIQKSELAKNIGMKGVMPFVVNNYINQAKNFSLEKLINLADSFAQTEEDIKTGIIGDRIGVELLIAESLS